MRNDPFAQLGALDQKLFATSVPRPAAPANETAPTANTPPVPGLTNPSNQETLEPRNQDSKSGRNSSSFQASKIPIKGQEQPAQPAQEAPLNLSMRPDRQNTYAFTIEELEQLEDLKIEVTRVHRISVTKNDLIRCALHMLLHDYQHRGEQSSVLKRLRQRRGY
jgi:hypothetical protein